MFSIITVNFKSSDRLSMLLESLVRFEQQNLYELIVVNNDKDDDLAALKARYPHVIWVEPLWNIGFGSACNLGRSKAKGDTLIFANPDIVWTEPILAELERTIKRQTGIGIWGIRQTNDDGTLQPSIRHFPRPTDLFLLLLKLPTFFPSLHRRWLWENFDYQKEQSIEQVMGAFLVMRTVAFDEIAGFDPWFFLWYEEVDLCKRASIAGWGIRYLPGLSVRHGKGKSFARVGTWRKQAYVRKSIRRYARKHFHWMVWPWFYIGEPVFLCASLVVSALARKRI
ncbi:glycosyltransferase [Candidatus Uhrbacteria bacterium]|nr:glycosyltransferase [Candidatus Uhrbacteria bacterium]